MSFHVRRKQILVAAVVLLGLFFIGWELFQLSGSVRMLFVRAAEGVGAYETIVAFLDDEDKDVRADAFDRLSHSGTRTVPALMSGLGDSRETVRLLSAVALRQIEPAPKEALASLKWRMVSDADEHVRAACAQTFGQIANDDEAIVADLIGILQNGDTNARISAAEALAMVKGDSKIVVAALGRALEDPAPRVREEAAESLSRFGSDAQAAIPALLKVLTDPVAAVRSEVREALWKIAHGKEKLAPELAEKVEKALSGTLR